MDEDFNSYTGNPEPPKSAFLDALLGTPSMMYRFLQTDLFKSLTSPRRPFGLQEIKL